MRKQIFFLFVFLGIIVGAINNNSSSKKSNYPNYYFYGSGTTQHNVGTRSNPQ